MSTIICPPVHKDGDYEVHVQAETGKFILTANDELLGDYPNLDSAKAAIAADSNAQCGWEAVAAEVRGMGADAAAEQAIDAVIASRFPREG